VNLGNTATPVDLHGDNMSVLLAWGTGVEVEDGKAMLPERSAAVLGPA